MGLALTAEEQEAYIQLLSSKTSNQDATRCDTPSHLGAVPLLQLRSNDADTCVPVTRTHAPSHARYLAEALQLPDYTHDARSSVQLDYAAWMCT